MDRRNFLASTAAIALAGTVTPKPATKSPYEWQQPVSERITRTREWRGKAIADGAVACGLTAERLAEIEAVTGEWLLGEEALAITQGFNVDLNWLFTGQPANEHTYPPGLNKRPVPPAA